MNAMNVMMGGAQPQTQVAVADKMPKLKSMNDNQFLDFETSKVQILTLDQPMILSQNLAMSNFIQSNLL